MKTQLDLAIEALEELERGEVINEYQVTLYCLSLLKQYRDLEEQQKKMSFEDYLRYLKENKIDAPEWVKQWAKERLA